ncbi:glucosyltransferase domain-containing protein [Swingsia samuiensis]|uniref:Glucosyl transferase GtrII family protein n=1 Tax=Swingsia samuiensis TaxID=1293412 RepID=A0A4Y6UK55_9PROT|nr:glucosyltransferase domain-containing protein [Swingsia samuiensis]QDH16856.1 hypothetical protein E3D00_04190 [Swingsia samuiensis]
MDFINPLLFNDLKKRFFIFFVLFLFFVYPIIQENIYYIDDLGRSVYGYLALTGNGRPIGDWIWEIMSFSPNYVSNLAPLTQIISVSFLAIALSFLSRSWRFSVLNGSIALSFLVCSPFLLANLSYRFDSITMTAALALITIPFSLPQNISNAKRIVLTSLVILITSNVYQAALNAFLVLLCLNSTLQIIDYSNKQSISRFIQGIIAFITGLVLYKIEIAVTNITNYDPYTRAHLGMVHDVHSFLGNIKNCIRLAFNEFRHGNLERFLGACMILGIIATFTRVFIGVRNRNKNEITLSLFLTFLFLGLSVLSIAGLLSLLKFPVIVPRTMMSVGAVCAFAVTFIIGRSSPKNIYQCVPMALGMLMLFGQFVFAYAWGNAEGSQSHLDHQLARQIDEDLFTLSGRQTTYVRILGDQTPTSAYTQLILNQHPIFRFDLARALDGWAWGNTLLKTYNLPNNISVTTNESPDTKPTMKAALEIRNTCHFDKIISRVNYNLYKLNDNIVIDFTHACSQ